MEVDKEFLEKQDIIIKLEDEKWVGNLEDYNLGGIWALFGKKAEDNDIWFCLHVGQTRNIADEISANIKCLDAELDELRIKHYVNQFGKEMFSYDEYPTCREQIYNKIMEEYEDLIFICVYKEDDNKKRIDIEKYYAWNTYPLYWRNGGPYKEAKNYSEAMLDKIKNEVINNMSLDDNIRKIIDSFLEHSSNKQIE